MATTEETLKGIVNKVLRKEVDFSDGATFKDFAADSLDIVQILVGVEEAFDIEIKDEDLQEIKTMGAFVAYIDRKVAEKGSKVG
ncbi:MAG: acyl carrier protein [Chloroflexi bacterium]|nr:acyl carrier protein [Chloroflexota bacterium]